MKYCWIVVLILYFLSCKKEEKFSPDDHITYTHWYQLKSNANDTLFSVYMANAFTPNGDGYNDFIGPEGYLNLKVFEIYSRNGNSIYKTNDQNKKWDGRINESPNSVMQGEYVYRINVADAAGQEYEYTGSIMLYK